jgi:hypothetical protein
VNTEECLGRLVPRFGGLDEEAFKTKFADEVGELEDEDVLGIHTVELPHYGVSNIWILKNGLTVLESAKGKYSLFESRARIAERDHINAWARYARGTWTRRVPREPGTYATRTLDGKRGKDRELRLVRDRLVDITDSFVPLGKTTTWQGEFWSEKLPTLPGAL